MIKLMFLLTISTILICSSHFVYAEELPLPEGKNVKEWESIAAALMKEERYDDAVIYLDKIINAEPDNLRALSNKAGILIHLERFEQSLEISNRILSIEPNRISTLQNKGVVLRILDQHENAFDTFAKIVSLQPDNEQARKSIAITLAEMPTVSTTDSPYSIHLQMKILDKDNNLIGVLESSNARYLPSKFFEIWWNKVDGLGMVTNQDGVEKLQMNEITEPEDDHLGMFTWEKDMEGWKIVLFQVFVPMMQYDGTERIEVQWTLIRDD